MIGVAILGAGIGREHLAGYRAWPNRFSPRWIVDLDTARARAMLEGDGGPEISDDIARALADPGVDLVDICLPPHLHAPTAIAALEAGKHVIVEKPIAASLVECDRIADAARIAGRSVFPVFQYRYGPAFAALDAMVAEGLAGQPMVGALETHWNRDAAYYANGWRGSWAGEMGGAILSHAIHAHDLLCRYFGPVAQVHAMLATRINPIETEDCAALSVAFENGALASSSVTLGAAQDTTRIRLVFEHLTATSGTNPYAPGTDLWQFTARDPDRQAALDAQVARHGSAPAGFTGFLEAVGRALAEDDTTASVGLESGRRSIELVSAIYAAARSGERVPLPLDQAHPVYRGWQP